MPHPFARLAVLLTLIAIVAAACGSGGDDRLSAEDYRQQADEICTASAEALGEIPDPQGLGDVVPALRRALPIVETLVDDLDALVPPEEFKASHDTAVGLLQEQIQVTTDAIAAIEDGEPIGNTIEEISPRLQQIQDEGETAARDLGLMVCGRES